MKEIQLTQGKVALVDDEDFDRVNQFKWFAERREKNWYGRRAFYVEGKRRLVYLHQFVTPGHLRLDHSDGNGLNNQKWNLRPAAHGQNIANARKRTGCSSKFKGVSWSVRDSVWRSEIKLCGRTLFLGNFSSEICAAKAYDVAARTHFKEFARLNFP